MDTQVKRHEKQVKIKKKLNDRIVATGVKEIKEHKVKRARKIILKELRVRAKRPVVLNHTYVVISCVRLFLYDTSVCV